MWRLCRQGGAGVVERGQWENLEVRAEGQMCLHCMVVGGGERCDAIVQTLQVKIVGEAVK